MGLIFDGVDIEAEFNVMIDGASSWPKPARRSDAVQVPGRNGDLLYDDGAWENVEITYNILVKAEWITEYERLTEWLCSHVGYFRLEDPDRHPGVYRMAEFTGPINPKTIGYHFAGTFPLEFNCKPQQFLTSGESALEDIPISSVILGCYRTDQGQWYFVDDMSGVAITTQITDFADVVGNDGKYLKVSFTNNKSYTRGIGVVTAYYDSTNDQWIRTSTSRGVGAGETVVVYLSRDEYETGQICLDGLASGLDDWDVSIEINGQEVSGNPSDIIQTIVNPTMYEALPLIRVTNALEYLSSAVGFMVRINDISVTVDISVATNAREIYIDAEMGDVYGYTTAEGLVHYGQYATVEVHNEEEKRDFLYFKKGNNKVIFTVSQKYQAAFPSDLHAEIIPRWWRI